jgi:hypothetical protein
MTAPTRVAVRHRLRERDDPTRCRTEQTNRSWLRSGHEEHHERGDDYDGHE